MSNLKNYLFTSESVSEGHPDKVSDRISDMVVDIYLSGDPFSRVACETLTTTNKVVLAGEVRGPKISKDEIIQKRLKARENVDKLSERPDGNNISSIMAHKGTDEAYNGALIGTKEENQKLFLLKF